MPCFCQNTELHYFIVIFSVDMDPRFWRPDTFIIFGAHFNEKKSNITNIFRTKLNIFRTKYHTYYLFFKVIKYYKMGKFWKIIKPVL